MLRAKSKRLISKGINFLFFLGNEHKTGAENWRFRRRLIYGGYRVAVAMIIFGAATFFWDTGVSNQMVIGGVALLSILLTGYTATATWEDRGKVIPDNNELEP